MVTPAAVFLYFVTVSRSPATGTSIVVGGSTTTRSCGWSANLTRTAAVSKTGGFWENATAPTRPTASTSDSSFSRQLLTIQLTGGSLMAWGGSWLGPAHAPTQQVKPAIAGGAGGLETARQAPAQTIGIEIAGDAAVLDDRDPTGFLGDDQDHRVRGQRESDGRPVTRAQAIADGGLVSQWQQATRCQDGVASHDDGAVVQRRVRKEQALQELGR